MSSSIVDPIPTSLTTENAESYLLSPPSQEDEGM